MVSETELDDPDVFFIPNSEDVVVSLDTNVHNFKKCILVFDLNKRESLERKFFFFFFFLTQEILLGIFQKAPDSDAAKYGGAVENILGVLPHKESVLMLIEPNRRVRISAGFRPKDDVFKSSLMLVRNNLTILDAIVLQGQGGHGDILFSNRKPGSTSPLLFELTEKHLKSCDRKFLLCSSFCKNIFQTTFLHWKCFPSMENDHRELNCFHFSPHKKQAAKFQSKIYCQAQFHCEKYWSAAVLCAQLQY